MTKPLYAASKGLDSEPFKQEGSIEAIFQSDKVGSALGMVDLQKPSLWYLGWKSNLVVLIKFIGQN